MFGVEGGSAFLECEPRSLQARVEWTFQRAGEAARTTVSPLPLGSERGPWPAPDIQERPRPSLGGPRPLPALDQVGPAQ